MAFNKAENELSLQIKLGLMDHTDGLLTKDEEGDLKDLMNMRSHRFFTGNDEYLQVYGIDQALRRFRQSPLGRADRGTSRIYLRENPIDNLKIINLFPIQKKIKIIA